MATTSMYMPASLPGMSITTAAEVLQTQDKIVKSFPEVSSVFGKAGRANTATDPAPTKMFETVIGIKVFGKDLGEMEKLAKEI